MIEYMHADGRFTCGVKYVCFKPTHGPADRYLNLFQRPDNVSEEEWGPLADFITNQLNKYKAENVR